MSEAIETNTSETNLDNVAASLIVKPAEAKAVEKAPVAKETPRVPEGEDNVVTEEVDNTLEEEAKVPVDDAAPEEEDSDTEAEAEEDVDIDELDIDVVVDGEEQKVKLKDLKANYSGEKAIEKRLQEASEARTYAVHHGQQLYIALEAEAVRLARIDDFLQKVVEPEIDWEDLKKTNPARYLLERDRQREAKEKQDLVRSELTQTQVKQQKLIEQATDAYTTQEARALIKSIPEFADAEKAAPMMQKLANAASAYGYTPQEVGAVMDHRAMLVLRDAMKYQELMNGKQQTVKKTVPSTALLRPNAAKSNKPMSTAKKLQEGLRKKAMATGKVEDVAALLMVKKK
jgi:hypothetical protein